MASTGLLPCTTFIGPERLVASFEINRMGVWRSGLLRQLHGLDRRDRRLRRVLPASGLPLRRRALDEAGPDRATPFDTLTAAFIADPEGADKAFQHVDDGAEHDPYLALTQVTTLTAIVNNAASKAGRLTKRLSDYIKKLKGTLDKIKRAVQAASYTITVGFPISVSIGVTFQ